MRMIICDDDPLIVGQLKKYIKSYFEQCHVKLPEVACFPDGKSLLEDTGDKDIVFLDIEMPGMNGIYVGNELKKANADVIIFIITSYSEYLDEAMRFHVFRYLSKPLDKQRFFRNMHDVIELYSHMTFKVPVETRQGVYALPASDILLVEALTKRVIVHTAARDFESVHTMQYWCDVLPKNCFFQTHRSFLINLEHVSHFEHDIIYMTDARFHAYLTKRKYSVFKEAYLLYLESTR